MMAHLLPSHLHSTALWPQICHQLTYTNLGKEAGQVSFYKFRPQGWQLFLPPSVPVHSLPAMDVAPGNTHSWHACFQEWNMHVFRISINNHWPWFLNEQFFATLVKHTVQDKTQYGWKPAASGGCFTTASQSCTVNELNSSLSLKNSTRRLHEALPLKWNFVFIALNCIALNGYQ